MADNEVKPIDKKQSAWWRNPWVIGWLSLLVVVLVMNIIMIMFSISGNPGVVTADYYDRGKDKEQNTLKKRARNPGWQMAIEAPEFIELDQPTTFRYTVTDREGETVQVDRVVFYAYRPSDDAMDFSKEMQMVEPGLYQVEVSFPLKGAWDLLVGAKSGEDEYHTSLRLGVGIDWVP